MSAAADDRFAGVNTLAAACEVDFKLPEGCAFCLREIAVEDCFPELVLTMRVGLLVPQARLEEARAMANAVACELTEGSA